MIELHTVIVGSSFRGTYAIAVLAGLQQGDSLRLAAEPNNEHDSNAVACYYGDTMIGYIPKSENYDLSLALRSFTEVTAVVVNTAIVDNGRVIAAPHICIEWQE